MGSSYLRGTMTGIVTVAATFSLAACGSNSSTTAASPTPSPTASALPSSGPADAATKAAVAKAYGTLFGGTKNLTKLTAALQNGDKLSAVLAAALKDPRTKRLTASVSKVTLINAHVASVTFSLLQHGSPILANTHGKAVLVNGGWTVAADTYCGLLGASGQLPPACTQAVIAVPTR